MRGIYTTTTSPGTIPWTTTTTTTSTRTRRASTYAASDSTTKRGAPGIIRPTGIAGSRRIGSPSWRAPTTSPRARTWRSAPTRRAMTSAASAAPCPPSPSSASAARSCQRLQVLWIARSGLEDLSGVGALVQLRELYAAFNDVTDVSPLAELDELQVVDLEANRVSDEDAPDYLGMCPALNTLSLEGNPISRRRDYRNFVARAV